jgi:hypothetical protein
MTPHVLTISEDEYQALKITLAARDAEIKILRNAMMVATDFIDQMNRSDRDEFMLSIQPEGQA